MINLTSESITLIAESGEATIIPASGLVARVAATRRAVGTWNETFSSFLREHIPIIEETPTEIVVEGIEIFRYEVDGIALLNPILAHDLLLVTRNVAEAAAFLKHPLAERMVWADEPLIHVSGLTDDVAEELVGYRSLRRVPRREAAHVEG